MHFICQTASEHPDTRTNIREIAAQDPIAIYFHGSRADKLWKAGQFAEVEDWLKLIRDTGKLVGIASHMPEVLRHVEDKGWDVDFYMACFYNISKVERESLLAGGKRVEEPFDDPDRDVMCEFIRSTEKLCIAYKILAASRRCTTPEMVRDSFEYAFRNIKPTDPVDVGMFQKNTDQIAMNAGIVRDILGTNR